MPCLKQQAGVTLRVHEVRMCGFEQRKQTDRPTNRHTYKLIAILCTHAGSKVISKEQYKLQLNNLLKTVISKVRKICI